MNPVETLLASLGACQSIVARVYAPKFDVILELHMKGCQVARSNVAALHFIVFRIPFHDTAGRTA